MTPEELIAEQDATITELRAQLSGYEIIEYDLRSRLKVEGDPWYWEGVYDRIRAAWDTWAFAELGTASPSHADLAGRPELAQLWETIR